MQTTAFVVGADDSPVAALKDLARQIGFSPVHTYRSPADMEERAPTAPLFFVLFASVERLSRLKKTVESIRASEDSRVRFAPLVYFSENPSLEVIKTCISMGFDDIVTLPFTLKRARERLARQLDVPMTYYGTDTYFGPDRRGRLPREEGHSMRGSGGTHRRIEIIRTMTGIRVLHDDTQVMV